MGKNNKIAIKINLFLLIKLLVFLLLNNHIKGCPYYSPILDSEGNCTSIICSESDMDSEKCKIDNEIIKTQWLNKMTLVGENGYQSAGVATYNNGDLIFEAIESGGKARYFYGLKKNGYIWLDNYKLNVNNNANNPYINIFTVFSNTEDSNEKKEYLVSIMNNKLIIELYDLENNKAYVQEITTSSNNRKYISFKIHENDNIYTIYVASTGGNLFIYKYNVVYSNTNKPTLQIVAQSDGIQQNGKIISCFGIASHKICCFFKTFGGFFLNAYNYNLKIENSNIISLASSNFIKCVHVKGDIGSLATISDGYPKILFFEYKNEVFEFYNEIMLDANINGKKYNNSFEYNDFIKISDNKISFIGYDIAKEYLIVILLKFIGPNDDIVIRYYPMDLKNLYNFELLDFKAHNYNNYISLIFNYNNLNQTNGEEKNNQFMIFSYPGITDNIIDLEEYILNHNKLNVYKFEVNLKKFVLIENNIFGYVPLYIKIVGIGGCEMFDITLQPKNQPLNADYILEESDLIKLVLLDKENEFNCQINYTFYATELNYKNSLNYTVHEDIKNLKTNDVNFNEEYYNNQTEIFQGKLGYYAIQLKNNLSDICEDNCKLCSIYSNGSMINCLKNRTEGDNNPIKKNSSKSISEMIDNLDEMMEDTDPDQSYIINGDGYTAIIKDLDEYIEDSTVNIDFSKCEKKLRANLPEDTKLRMVQLNIEKEGEDSLTDQVEYRVYDENGNPIDLAPCKDVEINIEYEITDLSMLDLDLIRKFKDLGVDVFDIKDEFFNDICRPYSDDDSNSDMILSDRVSDIYQNYSVCDGECEYESFDIDKLSFNCNCDVKQKISIEPEKTNFAASITSAFLDSNFGVVKCYKLVFSLKGKLKNAGFWIFTIFTIFHIIIYIYYSKGGLLPIQNYIKKEMKENGYIVNNYKINKEKKVRFSTEQNNLQTKNPNFPPKKRETQTEPKKKSIKLILYKFKKDKSNNISEDNDYGEKAYERKNTAIESEFATTKDFRKAKFNKKRIRTKNLNNMIANTQSSEIIVDVNEGVNVNKYKRKSSKKKKQEVDHLIFINAKNTDAYVPKNSDYNLDNYSYDEAIQYENRNFGKIFFIYLMSKESILNTFYYKQPLELMPLRILIFIFSNACDIALNCLFYLSDNISDKYHYEGKSAILFSLTNNITISLVSSIVGYCLIYFSQSLVQSTEKITSLFRDEEVHLKKDKKYKVKTKKNMDILEEIKKIFKCLKLKIIIFLVIEGLLMLFFFYYVTAFCHVYSSTQTSWLLDSLTSYGISLLTAFALSFIMSIVYKIAVKCKCKVLYKITLFIYSML